jgi:hypothetical protein
MIHQQQPNSPSGKASVAVETVRLTEEEKLYQEWTGNSEVPKKWKHFLAQTGRQYFSESPISIPFKPQYWQTITEDEKNNRSKNLEDETEEKDHFERRKGNSLWSTLNLEEFFTTIPWLNTFNQNQIAELEKEMIIMEFEENELILRKGDPMVFSLVK